MTPWQSLLQDSAVRWAGLVCFIGFFGFLIWAGFAPLAQGVIAYGQIQVENERKVVQHLEGGIIDTIHVVEGESVREGAPLITLTSVAAQSGREQYAQQLATAWIGIDRLTALLSEEEDWTVGARVYDVPLRTLSHETLIQRQKELFLQQSLSFEADLDVLIQRRSNARQAARAISAQISASQVERTLVEEDLALKRQLLAEQLIQATEVTALERDLAALNVRISGFEANRQNAQLEANEIARQIDQARARFREETNNELEALRSEATQAQQSLDAAQDVVNRTVIYAPQSGEVLNLKFATKGGVVKAGEAIMEIVPDTSAVIAVLEVHPGDRDVVHQGLQVRAQLSGLNSWRSPKLTGEVRLVSADLKTAQNGNYQYYEARVQLDEMSVSDGAIEILPGMPVEGFIVSGHSRTLLEYLLEPINGTLRRSLQG